MDGNGTPDALAAVEALVSEAESLGAEERWDEARSLLLEALDDHPDDPRLLCWLGIAAQRLGEEGEAYEHFRRALAQEPADVFVLATAGSGVAAYDDPQAERALRLAALTAPDFPHARSAYGAYLAREGLFGEAAAELEAARDLAPDDGLIRAELAMAYLLGGRGDDGLTELEEALAQQPEDDGWLRAVYGLALLEARRTGEGAEELHRAAAARPEDVEVQLLSALASAAEGWEDEARRALAGAEAVAEAPDRELLLEAEEAVDAGPEAAAALLHGALAPSVLRDRLLQRA
ncbi:MAG TPA: tetratricopeptide repeat protein [Longimicrobiaceae bacterium]|nr:tetratricopeptide repeat protein [Longimicrobiaceae bacterium]